MQIDKYHTEIKESILSSCDLLCRLGLDYGNKGHISVRNPEDQNQFYINSINYNFGNLISKEIVCTNISGEVLANDSKVNKPAHYIHGAIYNKRSDINAIIHVHSEYGQIWSATGKRIDCFNQDMIPFYKQHEVYANYSGIVNAEEEGFHIAEALGNNKALILKNHGILAVGRSIEAAVWWVFALEKCCKTQVFSFIMGNCDEINPDELGETAMIMGADIAAEKHFRTLKIK